MMIAELSINPVGKGESILPLGHPVLAAGPVSGETRRSRHPHAASDSNPRLAQQLLQLHCSGES